MMNITLMIFDLDGTLVDSRIDIFRAVNHTLEELDIEPKSLEEVTSYIGTGVKDLIRQSLGGGNEEKLEKALSIFKEYYGKHANDNAKLYPGVKDTLDHFKEKKKVIITNRRHEFTLLTLRHFGIEPWFDSISGGDDIGCLKPSSCPLDNAIDGLKMDKKKTMIIGDMAIDVRAGKNAGIITCAVTYGIGKKSDIAEAGPDFMINDIRELKNLIE